MAEPQTDPETQSKPPISAARLAANRANSALSTGPRSRAGKEKSRFNGLVHGLRAALPIIPGEDPEALEHRLDAWTDEFGARTDSERYLVAQAVDASWRMDRAGRVEAAALTRLVHDAEERFDDRLAAAVGALARDLGNNPAAAVRALRRSTPGCRWLLEQWGQLADRLQAWMSFEPTQRHRAILLSGKRPEDLFEDAAVLQWDVAYVGALLGRTEDTDKVGALLRVDRPEAMGDHEYGRRVALLCAALPEKAGGHATLKQYVAAAIAELEERVELVAVREERDRALAVQEAAFDASPAGASRLRYEMAQERKFRASLHELRVARESRRDREEAVAAGPEVPTHGAPTEPKLSSTAEAPTEPKLSSTAEAPTEPKPDDEAEAPTEPKLSSTSEAPTEPKPDAEIEAPTEPKLSSTAEAPTEPKPDDEIEAPTEPKPTQDVPRRVSGERETVAPTEPIGSATVAGLPAAGAPEMRTQVPDALGGSGWRTAPPDGARSQGHGVPHVAPETTGRVLVLEAS